MRKIVLVLLAALALPAAAEVRTVRFYGYAYDLASNRYLYTEIHEQQIEGDRWLGGSIRYYGPDGAELGAKSMDFRADPFVPVYRLELKARGGYAEGISKVSDNGVEMFKKGYKAKKNKTAHYAKTGPTAADSGFHSFLRAHFQDLLAGKTVRFHFVAAGNLDAYRFRAKRIGETTFEGKPAVRLRAEPDTLLRLLVDPLELTYDPEQRRLLEYRGVSNIHDPATGNAYNARIAYYATPPADAPQPLPPLN